jgi:hypothetical protein
VYDAVASLLLIVVSIRLSSVVSSVRTAVAFVDAEGGVVYDAVGNGIPVTVTPPHWSVFAVTRAVTDPTAPVTLPTAPVTDPTAPVTLATACVVLIVVPLRFTVVVAAVTLPQSTPL